MAKEIKIGDTVYMKMNDNLCHYTILNSRYFDINKNEISLESPVGGSLIGHKKGDIVQVSLPDNRYIKCEILKIAKI
jgi:transcription elongation GreA/GreB family factor